MTDLQTRQFPLPKFWRAFLPIYFTITLLVGVAGFLEQARYSDLLGQQLSGRRGAVLEVVPDRPGWYRITQLMPGSSAEKNGLRLDDLVRYDVSYEAGAVRPAGYVTPITVERGGRQFRTAFRYVASQTRPIASLGDLIDRNVVAILGDGLMWMLGLFLLIRARGQLSALLLGSGLAAAALPTTLPWWITSVPGAATWTVAVSIANLPLVGLLAFPVALYWEAGGEPGRRWKAFYGAMAALSVAVVLYGTVFAFTSNNPIPWLGTPLFLLFWVGGGITAAYWTLRGHMATSGSDRNRFATVLLAYGLIVVLALSSMIGGSGFSYQVFRLILLANGLLTTGIALLLAYAVLRHKVVDVGFAINRTLLFGVVSAILLVAFGLLEWAAHHLLPEEWSKASAWIDGGIALSLYLGFHRVRDFVEHHLEHLFFHRWQQNEAKLRRFIASAAHFEAGDALAQAFAVELARFAGDAPVAVYTRQGQMLVRDSANFPGAAESLAEADPAFALMRAERAPLDLAEVQTGLPGVLALPMLDHGTLAGFAVLGAKPDGNLYRPDEIEVLGWAAHQVGLDLAALRARQIETENRALRTQLELLGRPPLAPAPYATVS